MIWIGLAVVLFVPLVVIIFVVGIYNRLVTLKNRFQNAFSQIEVQLKRRYDLIPNLVETVTHGPLPSEYCDKILRTSRLYFF